MGGSDFDHAFRLAETTEDFVKRLRWSMEGGQPISELDQRAILWSMRACVDMSVGVFQE